MVLLFFLVLLSISALLALHELGHFILAKKFGVKVEEFGIGFPPRIFGKKIGETIYSINLIPFGAFVKLLGEEERKDIKGSFSSKPVWQRVLIVLGGVIMFWIIGFLVLFLILSLKVPIGIGDGDWKLSEKPVIQIIEVLKGTPAEANGLIEGDKIIEIKKEREIYKVDRTNEFQELISKFKGEKISLKIERSGKILEISLVPRKEYPEGEGPIGIGIKRVVYPTSLFSALKLAGYFTGKITLDVLKGLYLLFSSLIKEKSIPKGMEPMSVVGIFYFFYQAAKVNLIYFFELLAIISIYLAVFNLLPIPALDGGKLLFLGIEAIRKKPVSPKLEQKITAFFFLILLFLVIFVTFRFDIPRLLK